MKSFEDLDPEEMKNLARKRLSSWSKKELVNKLLMFASFGRIAKWAQEEYNNDN